MLVASTPWLPAETYPVRTPPVTKPPASTPPPSPSAPTQPSHPGQPSSPARPAHPGITERTAGGTAQCAAGSTVRAPPQLALTGNASRMALVGGLISFAVGGLVLIAARRT